MNAIARTFSIILGLASASMPACAACIVDPGNRAPPLLREGEADPKGTIEEARKQLRQHPDADAAGWLWATIATAEFLLDDPGAAANSAATGLSVLANQPMSPARAQLQIIAAQTIDTEAGARTQIVGLTALRKRLASGTGADVCTLLAIATLQHDIDAPGAATQSITQAYRMSLAPGLERERSWTAMVLAAVFRRAGDRAGANALMDESITFSRRTGQPIALSNALYQKGLMRIDEKRYRDALIILEEASAIAHRLQGPQSAAYMDMGACEASLGIPDIDRAERACNAAAATIEKTLSARKINLLLGRVALARDRPKTALAFFGRALARADDVATSSIITDALEMRARTRARLGDVSGAYSDLSLHVTRLRARYDSVLQAQTAELRAQMKTDREEAKNAALTHIVTLARERNRAQQRLILGLGSATAAIVLLLGAIVGLSCRYQRRLKIFAETDLLTGLPNRGSIERSAFAPRNGSFTIALLDLDHFKAINDTHGHAVGDEALRHFARLASAALRSGDLIGRWGGEEFLAIFPDSDPLEAQAILERLRARLSLPEHAIIPDLHINFSAGIGTMQHGRDLASTVMVAIDAALYRAKAMGRGRSVICTKENT